KQSDVERSANAAALELSSHRSNVSPPARHRSSRMPSRDLVLWRFSGCLHSTYARSMSDPGAGRPRVFAHRRWLLLCSAALVVFATVLAFHSRSRGEAAPLRVAAGVTGGALHPIAGNFVPDRTQLADCGAD